MKLENMTAQLIWLIKYAQENKLKEFKKLKKLKKDNSPWKYFDSFGTVELWIGYYVKTKAEVALRTEELLRQLGLISHTDFSESDGLTKASLREIAGLMKIKEHNHKILKKDLEKLIDQKLEELNVPNVG